MCVNTSLQAWVCLTIISFTTVYELTHIVRNIAYICPMHVQAWVSDVSWARHEGGERHFVSGSHDGSLKLWSAGAHMRVFTHTHAPLIYMPLRHV